MGVIWVKSKFVAQGSCSLWPILPPKEAWDGPPESVVSATRGEYNLRTAERGYRFKESVMRQTC